MPEAWLNLIVVGFVEFALLMLCALHQKNLSHVPDVLWRGLLTGIVVGLVTDFLLGNVLGFWSYTLGHGVFTVLLVAGVVYGIFSATILLLQEAQFLHFCIWTILIMAVYEAVNHFFPVWTYHVPLPFPGLLIFLVVGNFVIAVFVAGVWHLFGYRFRVITELLHLR